MSQVMPHTAPVLVRNRFESLDMLRGFAVMGILPVNVQMFLMYWGALDMPPVHMDITGPNAVVWRVTYTFFEMKFITIFSALFGAGIVLMMGEAENASRKLHYSRMIWLLVFGLVHGFVFWFGDILTGYALAGMLAVLFRRMSIRRLLIWGSAAILLTNLLLAATGWSSAVNPIIYEPQPFGVVPDQQSLQTWISAYQSGFWPSRMFNAIGNLLVLFQNVIFFGPRILGVMMVGMALYKSGFLLGTWSLKQYGLVAALCLLPCLPLLWGMSGLMTASDFSVDYAWMAKSLNAFASLVVALGYAAVAMIIVKLPWLKLMRHPFTAAGRMAFTNYLVQTFVMTFIATEMGLFGVLERVEQARYVTVVWIAQLVISVLWLRVFRFGPFEWLWRRLSYGGPLSS